MLDFMMVSTRMTKQGSIEVYPKFIVGSKSDLMIRGGDFYAIWNEEEKLWSTKEEVALYLIDKELDAYVEKHKAETEQHMKVLHMWDSDSCMIDKWHKYVQKQLRDSYHSLDEKLIFSNTETTKTDYASKKLPYPLENSPVPAYDELMSTLYSPEERRKIEWAIGSVISGDSKKIQKFVVMYGAAGTGKSTVLNIIQDLFDGYYSVFDSKALGSANNSFALEAFKSNPLVAIQHDGDLSHIEDNTRLNSLVSHEIMTVNEKFKSAYSNKFNSFLFMGTNKPVRITDSKSGIIRRLIDVSPTGEKIPSAKYKALVSKIKFELGGIASHCLEVYNENSGAYDNYIPTTMIGATNDFYNFVLDSYDTFKKDDSTTLKASWEMYKNYCDEARVPYPYSQKLFKEELKSYFKEFEERGAVEEGSASRVRNLYKGFISEKFIGAIMSADEMSKPEKHLLELNCTESLLDIFCKDCPAQYASENETPLKSWDDVTSKLSDISTKELHYVRVPENLIVIDFDIRDAAGNKCFELNAEAAAKWPSTYAELSKGGQGIHLHYIYNGDVTKLSAIYDENIEVKVFTGKSSLRRRLSKCNDIPIATISTGLPLKEEKKVIDFEGFKNDKALITFIKRNLNKEYPPHATKTSIEFIFKGLEQAYADGLHYDVSAMERAIRTFAGRSTHNADYCMRLVDKMKFRSEELNPNFDGYDSGTIIFFDVEVFSNLFVVVWKARGSEYKPVKMINPSSNDISQLIDPKKFKLIGFNNRDYDNHILYGRLLGETNEQLFQRSQSIISNVREAKFGNAYNLSYTDILDFSAKKQSLKKFEIELGIHHQELGLPWNEPVPEDKWELVADYCVNDVLATEAVFEARYGDFIARQILAEIAGGTVNDTTNTLTTRLIFGNNRAPQKEFRYRDLSKPVSLDDVSDDELEFLKKNFPVMMEEQHEHDGVKSILPFFPGYIFEKGISKYKGFEVGEGGFVYTKPGIYSNVYTYDVASMHPHSLTSLYLLGFYTKIFNELLEARILIKHKEFDKAKELFGGKLAPYLTDAGQAKALAGALKIAINSVYGLTAQREKNGYCSPFRDVRNIDNIVAKRGALFMIDLLTDLLSKGAEVIHIKTDSIKVVNPSPELHNYILHFGKRYGYDFEIEHKFEKICLVNKAVYIAKLSESDEDWISDCKKAEEKGLEKPTRWTATGEQFAVPYVFKYLFSHEPIEFADMCETFTVQTALYLDMNERTIDQINELSAQLEKLERAYKKDQNDITADAIKDLKAQIAILHRYHFVGKAGQFSPIKPGCGGGELLREKAPKEFAYATGAKGYRWLESEYLFDMANSDIIDKKYYMKLIDDAKDAIAKYGDVEWFCE